MISLIHFFVVGFVIDSMNQFIIVIECLRELTLSKTFHKILTIQPEDGKILYNSEIIFKEVRLKLDTCLRIKF